MPPGAAAEAGRPSGAAPPGRTGSGGAERLRIGVDVGGTNTDAALLRGRTVLARTKTPTTSDVTEGIVRALRDVLAAARDHAEPDGPELPLRGIMLGTTHFVNALLERKGLLPTAVLRLCGPATTLLPPLCEWPPGLREAVGGWGYLLPGGHEFDGREIVPLDEDALRRSVDFRVFD